MSRVAAPAGVFAVSSGRTVRPGCFAGARRLVAVLAVAIVGLAVVPAAWATDGTNVFSGNWTTNIGPVAFRVIDASSGASALQGMGGSPCGAPTTYYHGDYSDSGGTGQMTACEQSAGHLVGRYVADPTHNPQGAGGFDVTFSAPSSFSGFYTGDDFPGQSFAYSATFVSHFSGDGCCPAASPPPTPTPTPTPSGGSGGGVGACESSFSRPASIARVCQEPAGPVRSPVTDEEKVAAEQVVRRLIFLYLTCADVSYVRGKGVFLPFASTCQALLNAAVNKVETVLNDPPDERYREVEVVAASRADRRRAGHESASGSLKRAQRAYQRALRGFVGAARGLATSANRFSAAQRSGSQEGMLAQTGAGKTYAGLLAIAMARLPATGPGLARALRSAGQPLGLSGAHLKRAGKKGARRIHSKAVKRTLAAELRRLPGSVNLGRLLSSSLPSGSFERTYHTITLTEIAAMVASVAQQGQIPAGSASLLADDITAIQNAADAAAQDRAISQLALDARDRTPGSASTLIRYAALGLTTR